jgi:hypothetical protein
MLIVLDRVKRTAHDWADGGEAPSWLAHSGERLRAAEGLLGRPDLAANLDDTDHAYLTACRAAEETATAKERTNQRSHKRMQTAVMSLMAAAIVSLAGWINQDVLAMQWHWQMTVRPYIEANMAEHILTPEQERRTPEDAPKTPEDAPVMFCPYGLVGPVRGTRRRFLRPETFVLAPAPRVLINSPLVLKIPQSEKHKCGVT